MNITIVAAMVQGRCIGSRSGHKGLPWHLPGDMKHFRAVTKGKPMIFGRTTFEAFGGKPLPNRPNIVVTRNTSYRPPRVAVAHSLDAALALAKSHGTDDIIIGGGSQIYQQALDMGVVTRMILTEIDLTVDGDAFFPAFELSRWREVSREPQVEDGVSYAFVTYEKSA